MPTASMNFKADIAIKKQFETVAKNLGISSSALMNIFVTRVAQEQAIPFEVKVIKKAPHLDDESQKEMVRVLAIENGLIPDTDEEITNFDAYFKQVRTDNGLSD